ncbi:hypothetical protein Areg01_22420 [Actinoplanes regularis]|nr:hypothetical protein Areg01_22420 [Actinoplanes regularis]
MFDRYTRAAGTPKVKGHGLGFAMEAGLPSLRQDGTSGAARFAGGAGRTRPTPSRKDPIHRHA